MIIPEVTPAANRYVANGSTLNFAYSFPINDSAEILVLQEDSILVYRSHFDLTGIGTTNGGIVQMYYFVPDGTHITILRASDIAQLISLPANSSYSPPNVEFALNEATKVDQMLAERIRRAPKFHQKSNVADLPIEEPVALQFLRFNSNLTAIESANITSIVTGTLTTTLTPVRVTFADSATNLNTDANLLWDNTLKQLTVGSGSRSVLNSTGLMNVNVFNPNDTLLKSGSAYFHYSDPGNHPNFMHSSATVTSQPVGSGLDGPASIDVGLFASCLKQGFNGPSLVPGEVAAAYFVARNGRFGDTSGFLIDVAAYNSNGFSCLFEGHNSQFDPVGNRLRLLDAQMSVIDPLQGNFVGLYLACTTGGCSDGLRIDSIDAGWTNGINLLNGDFTNAIAIANQDHIASADAGGVVRGILSAFGDNTVHLGWHTQPPEDGHIVFIHGGDTLGVFGPLGTAIAGYTNFALAYNNGATQVVAQIQVGAPDSESAGFRVLRVPN